MISRWIVKNRRAVIFACVALLHVAALALVRFALPSAGGEIVDDYEILKLVDVEEFVPPPEDPKVTTVYNQPTSSEDVIGMESPVVEITDVEPDYLPQHKVSEVPGIPTGEILSRIDYPPIALRQGIEGVVYLELFIDETGRIRRTKVLKDPGYGFAEAALASLQGVRCRPAKANGMPVAVRFRYPVRFTLK